MERLLSMILRTLVNKGINFGIKSASNRGRSKDSQSGDERQMNQQGQQNAKGLRNATKMLRRFGKF